MTAILDPTAPPATPPARGGPGVSGAPPAGTSAPDRPGPAVEPARSAPSVALARARSALFAAPAHVSVPAVSVAAGSVADGTRAPAMLSVRGRRVPVATAIRAYGVAMLGLFALAIAVQPATDAPAARWAVLLSELALNGMVVVLVGTLLARRWAAPAGLACAVTFSGLSVSCPVSGHHAYAAWWGIQLAAGAAMVALSAATHRTTRRRP